MSQEEGRTTCELVASNLAGTRKGAQERKRRGTLLDKPQACANLHLQVLLLRQMFWGCVPTFLDNDDSIKKFEKLIESGREKEVWVLIGQCPKNGQLFNTTDKVFSSKVMQLLLDKTDGAFIASDWIPLCRGSKRGAHCKECVDELPNSGTAEESLCHAGLFALLSLLYVTDLIWQVKTIHCIGHLASRALVAGGAVGLKSKDWGKAQHMNEMLANLLPEGVKIKSWPHPGVLPRSNWLWGLRALNVVTRSCGIANWVKNLSGKWLTQATGRMQFAKKRLGAMLDILSKSDEEEEVDRMLEDELLEEEKRQVDAETAKEEKAKAKEDELDEWLEQGEKEEANRAAMAKKIGAMEAAEAEAIKEMLCDLASKGQQPHLCANFGHFIPKDGLKGTFCEGRLPASSGHKVCNASLTIGLPGQLQASWKEFAQAAQASKKSVAKIHAAYEKLDLGLSKISEEYWQKAPGPNLRICQDLKCFGHAECGQPGETTSQAVHCKKHRLPYERHLHDTICSQKGCYQMASFGKKGQPATACSIHQTHGVINVRNPPCTHPGCDIEATFNFPWIHARIYCRKHKLGGMRNLALKTCVQPGCERYAYYGHREDQVPLVCRLHTSSGLEDVVNKLCEQKGCSEHPSFGYPDDGVALRCKAHELQGMINVNGRICRHTGCTTRANFGDPVNRVPMRCASHKLYGMIDVQHKECEHPGCSIQPCFGSPVNRVPLRCKAHKLDGMRDVRNKPCEHPGCSKQRTFGLPEDGRPLRCLTHRLEGMEDVRSKRCAHLGCNTRPVFGYENEGTTLFCKLHKLEGMINVRAGRCEHPGCSTWPCFGLPEDGKPLRCVTHKSEDMVDVINRQCTHLGCSKQPAFGYKGEGRPKFCSLHKLNGMEDILSKRCEHLGCTTKPSYGHEADGIARFCKLHKIEGMRDVNNQRCAFPGCITRPSYGYEGDARPKFCKLHKLEGMKDVVSRQCAYPGCSKQPNYGDLDPEKRVAMWCVTHKDPGMIDVRHKHCKEVGCTERAEYGLDDEDRERQLCKVHGKKKRGFVRIDGLPKRPKGSSSGDAKGKGRQDGSTPATKSPGSKALRKTTPATQIRKRKATSNKKPTTSKRKGASMSQEEVGSLISNEDDDQPGPSNSRAVESRQKRKPRTGKYREAYSAQVVTSSNDDDGEPGPSSSRPSEIEQGNILDRSDRDEWADKEECEEEEEYEDVEEEEDEEEDSNEKDEWEDEEECEDTEEEYEDMEEEYEDMEEEDEKGDSSEKGEWEDKEECEDTTEEEYEEEDTEEEKEEFSSDSQNT